MDILSTTGVADYLALKQVQLKSQVNVKMLKTANEIANQQAQQLIELIEGAKGGNINIRA